MNYALEYGKITNLKLTLKNKQMKTYKTTIPEVTLRKNKTDFVKAKIRTSKDSEEYIRQFYSDDIGIYESFFVLMLNNANNTIAYAKISQGGIVGTMVDVKILLKYAIESLASGIIIAHNHPSGTLKPSGADKIMTERIKKACDIIDVKLLDHVILTEEGYFSFCDEGII